jgi:hypothetical protein
MEKIDLIKKIRLLAVNSKFTNGYIKQISEILEKVCMYFT